VGQLSHVRRNSAVLSITFISSSSRALRLPPQPGAVHESIALRKLSPMIRTTVSSILSVSLGSCYAHTDGYKTGVRVGIQ